MRVAIYVRCSTAEQTVTPQLEGVREYAALRGFEVVEEYLDEGVSGAKGSRPGLNRLLADARRRRFDALLIWRLDRLARSVRHLTELAAELEALGVDLVVLDQAIDTSTASGRFLFHTLAAVAEFERDLISDRTRAGLASAKRRGQRVGRPRVHVPLAKVRTLLAQGASVAGAARALGISRATLQRVLKRDRADTLVTPRETAAPGS